MAATLSKKDHNQCTKMLLTALPTAAIRSPPISEGVTDLLSGDDAQDTETLMAVLNSATVSAKPPPGWNFESELANERVRVDRVNVPRGEDWREQRGWFIYLASER